MHELIISTSYKYRIGFYVSCRIASSLLISIVLIMKWIQNINPSRHNLISVIIKFVMVEIWNLNRFRLCVSSQMLGTKPRQWIKITLLICIITQPSSPFILILSVLLRVTRNHKLRKLFSVEQNTLTTSIRFLCCSCVVRSCKWLSYLTKFGWRW